MVKTVRIDFAAVACDPRHLSATGHGWRRRLLELGASQEEAQAFYAIRLHQGMAATIELQRIKALAGDLEKNGT